MKPTVCLIYGGTGGEHQVSCQSAIPLYQTLIELAYPVVSVAVSQNGAWHHASPPHVPKGTGDVFPVPGSHGILMSSQGAPLSCQVAIPCVHGVGGEDGSLQGVFAHWGIPYVGCDIEASALAMHKAHSKTLAAQRGVPTLPHLVVSSAATPPVLPTGFSYPLFVKPTRGGSSLGASPVWEEEALMPALQTALRHDMSAIIEPYLVAREIEVAIWEDNGLHISPPGELCKQVPFYDYHEKYETGNTSFAIPAPLDDKTTRQIQDYAKQVFIALGCRHLARVDFFVNKTGIYFNEINTFPGFTRDSMFPRLAAATGYPLPRLLASLVEAAL